MEQIIRKDGRIYYGEELCCDIDDAYMRFRRDYHDSIGRKAFSRLDRLGQRKERIHGFGYIFTDGESLLREFHDTGRHKCYLLGLLHISYCWILGRGDMPDFDEDKLDRWLDWAFMKGSGALSFIGKRDKVGRTSRLLKKRFR